MCYFVDGEETGVTNVCVILFTRRRPELPVYVFTR